MGVQYLTMEFPVYNSCSVDRCTVKSGDEGSSRLELFRAHIYPACIPYSGKLSMEKTFANF